MHKVAEITAPMFIRASNRSPIMMIDGTKQKALEDEIKSKLRGNLQILLTHSPTWRTLGPDEVLIKPSSGKRFGSGSLSDVEPHARRVRITIEIE